MQQQHLEEFVAYLHRNVPLSAHLGLSAGGVDDDGLWLWAPLAPNLNDKRSAFAGTLAALCTLSGWAMVSLICREASLTVDVAVTRSSIAYLHPVRERRIVARCTRPAAATVASFLDTMRRKHKARLALTAAVAGSVAYEGEYAARVPATPPVGAGGAGRDKR